MIIEFIVVKCFILLISSFEIRASETQSQSSSLKDSYDCSLIREYLGSSSKSASNSLQSFFKSTEKYVKCGILPAAIANNQHYNAKFLIKWEFKTDKSIQVDFLLDSVEDFSSLKYYFAIRRFDADEFNLGVNEFKPEIEPAEITTTIQYAPNETVTNTSFSSTKNTIVLNVNLPVASHHHGEFDQLKNAFITCVIILNTKLGVSFNLPFMCVDIFIDEFYYEKDKVKEIRKFKLKKLFFFFFFFQNFLG